MHGIFLGNGALHLGNHCLGVCHDGEIIIATILEYVGLNVVVTFVGIVIDGLRGRLAQFLYLDVVVGALVVVLKDIANVGGKSEAHVAVNL